MNEATKVGIGLIIAGLGISVYFGVSSLDLIQHPPTELPIDIENSFLLVAGTSSGGLLITGIIILAVGFTRSKNRTYEGI